MALITSPISDIESGKWVVSPLYQKVDETIADDADYISSPDNPCNNQCEMLLSGISDPNTSTGHALSFRYQKYPPGSLPIDLTVGLYQGATLISARKYERISDSWTTDSFTLSESEANSISDYSNLRVKFLANRSLMRYSYPLPIAPTVFPNSGSAVQDQSDSGVYRLVFRSGDAAIWQYLMPTNYTGLLQVNLAYEMENTTGLMTWCAEIWAVNSGVQEGLNTKSFDLPNTVTVTTPTTAGYLGTATINCLNKDLLSGGAFMQLRVKHSGGTATGYANLLALSLDYDAI